SSMVIKGGLVFSCTRCRRSLPLSPYTTLFRSEAGLRAVQEFMEGLCQVTLEDVLNVEMGDGHVVVTGVQLSVRGRAPEFLVGSAMVHSDPVEAAVRSVLDALNRKLVLFRMEEEMV